MKYLNRLHEITMADLYKPNAGLTVWVLVSIENPREQCKDEDDKKRDKYNACNVGIS